MSPLTISEFRAAVNDSFVPLHVTSRHPDRFRGVIRAAGVRCAEVGRVETGVPSAVLVTDGRETDFTPRFRESAYTPLKKVVDKRTGDVAAMQAKVETAALAAIEKKERVKARLAARRG